MLKLLGLVWTVWKLASKRFGPVLGAIVAVVATVGYLVFKRWLRRKAPGVAEFLD